MSKDREGINSGALASGIVVVIGGAVSAAVGSSDFIRGFGVGIILVGAALLGLALSRKV